MVEDTVFCKTADPKTVSTIVLLSVKYLGKDLPENVTF